jgi:endonuclease-3
LEQAVREALLTKLEQVYGEEGCGLNFGTPFELLIATMLSAQTTDVQVNKVTPALFARCPDAQSMAGLTQEELEQMIRSIGFYHTKARHILDTARALCSQYQGRVPDTMEELVKLPGVGRKTANVVLANAMGQDRIAVDTHVFRVSNRLGLAHAKDVLKTEEQLMENIPQNLWSRAHHWLIWHGRRVCYARKPACERCPVAIYCEDYRRRLGEKTD